MAQFDLANAQASSSFTEDIVYPWTGYVPFVYTDHYPSIMVNIDAIEEAKLEDYLTDPSGNAITHWYQYNDPINSSEYTTGNIFYKRQQNYSHTNFGTFGFVPYNPTIHPFVDGNLRIGLGTTAKHINKRSDYPTPYIIGGAYRHGTGLYNAIYTNGIDIGGTVYTFPIDFSATVGSGGNWYPKDGSGNGTQVTDADTDFQYTGNNSSNANQVFSYTHARNIVIDVVNGADGIADDVIEIMTGSEDAFPYDNTLAQHHFDIMCLIAYIKGSEVLKQSAFINEYKKVDGTSVTSSSDLDAYDNTAYQLMWFTVMPVLGMFGYRFDASAVDKMQSITNLFLTGDSTDTSHNLNRIVTPFDTGLPNHTSITRNPDWYEGPAISEDFHFAPQNYKPGDYQSIDKIPPGEDPSRNVIIGGEGSNVTIPWKPIPIDVNSDGVINIDDVQGIFAPTLPNVDFWANNNIDLDDYRDEIYDSTVVARDVSEEGQDYWFYHPIYQSYYAAYWQDGNSFFHGKTALSGKSRATKHGAVLASTGENQLPSFIIGLNENGGGDSKVYMRGSKSSASVVSGVSGAFNIADGKTLGTIDYGQWNHFAITRNGTTFRTFKNGVQQDTWQSDKELKIPIGDTNNYVPDSLALSIGRSQGSDYFYGYIDGLKITKGVSKYNANFTPSTTAPTVDTTSANYYGKHHIETVATALDSMATQLDVEYRLRIGTDADNTNRPIPGGSNTGKLLLDVGPRESMFAGHSSDPTTLIVREGSGDDPAITGLNPKSIKTSFDATEYVSLVEYIYSDGNTEYDALDVIDDKNPYRGLNGEPLERATYVTEPAHPYISREQRALAFLNELKRTKRSINLDLDYYDIQGDFEVGDNIFVYDPDLGFEDNDDKVEEDPERTTKYEVAYQGQFVNPEKIRVTAITWPIKPGYGVYLRRLTSAKNNTYQYINLTDYVSFEDNAGTTLEVGDLPLKLGDDLRFSSAVSGISVGEKLTQPQQVSNVALVTGFIEDAVGESQAIIKVTWDTPLNVDGTIIQNGLHYRIRYRKVASTDPYTVVTQKWGTTEYTIEGLALATNYEVGVQPVNSNNDENDFTSDTITTAIDTDAPSKPAGADSISAGALRTQIVHSLGRVEDDQGNPISGDVVNFTLQNDIDYLNVYVSTQDGFSITGTEPKGTLKVSAGQIRAQVPVVGEIALDNGDEHFFRITAVDRAGNESTPSDQQSATGQLVGTQQISNLGVTSAKIAELAVTTGKIVDAAITNAKIADTIQSDNYVADTSGWIIEKQNASYPNGFAEFNDIVARGEISATTGDIGGWTISSSKLSSGNLDLDGSSNYIRGNYSAGSTGFTLNNDGSVEFNDATIRGDLEAGTISIGSSAFQVNSSGQLFMGNSVFGSAPFRVDTDGSVTCTDITIASGEIHIGT